MELARRQIALIQGTDIVENTVEQKTKGTRS